MIDSVDRVQDRDPSLFKEHVNEFLAIMTVKDTYWYSNDPASHVICILDANYAEQHAAST